MENKNQKLSYEELNKAASELHVQYQKLLTEYQKAMSMLQAKDFEYMSFFLQMLFKVVDHSEKYSADFSVWAIENIENMMTQLAAATQKNLESEDEPKAESNDGSKAEN